MIWVIMAGLGLCMGSFVNALVWRLHEQEQGKKSRKLSILRGHSMCPHCKHRLHARDLIPVLSWLEVRGRCRYCQKPIGWQYPLVELLAAGLFVASYAFWPHELTVVGWIAFATWLLNLVIIVALAVYDLRWMLLPNRLVYPLAVTSLLTAGLISLTTESWSFMLGSFSGALFLFGLFYGLFQISAGRWIGGGDVKLAIALGLLSGGFVETLLILFLASLLGTICSVPLLVINRKLSQRVPFGPFLLAATIIVFLFATPVIDWFTETILLM